MRAWKPLYWYPSQVGYAVSCRYPINSGRSRPNYPYAWQAFTKRPDKPPRHLKRRLTGSSLIVEQRAALAKFWSIRRARQSAAWLLTGSYHNLPPNFLADLTSLLEDPDPERRRVAVDLLCRLDARSAIPAIARLADDEQMSVRASVAAALNHWGGPVEALERLRHDPEILVRGCARWVAEVW